jgi:hypothetical protein
MSQDEIPAGWAEHTQVTEATDNAGGARRGWLDIPRIASAIVVIIIVGVGGVVTISSPETLPFPDYIQGAGVAAGLLGIGLGIDQNSRP